MNELKINDIKNLVSIPDISFYILILLIVLGIVIIGFVGYLIYRFFKNKKNPRKKYYETIKNINLSDTKNAAYQITFYARKLAKNEREIKISEELITLLEEYKYKKDVKKFENNILQKYELFMETIDV
ncbi:conserved hypothetical protein [Arcobacter nitrofigilis DSM 7299]|uniref:Uncharacterized protein n=1 Tax=Arcobacter nitrofigilis (strain ATCC 33309 / DSM 7299 / CCUG 15893 / LMG 7604 / NCTC 12251 / CI) TaxID=572480 RepID=D5V2K6_ARCNC|nr:hypothetical protein [Arcobacter nitrofigilis]ADG92438.1 conserved hypothetical protein [Arcobacter nitrofigilis DSM 7299]